MQTTTEKRFIVTTWHGENGSRYHVVDSCAPESAQPAIVVTYRTHEDARRHAEGLNIADGMKGSRRYGPSNKRLRRG